MHAGGVTILSQNLKDPWELVLQSYVLHYPCLPVEGHLRAERVEQHEHHRLHTHATLFRVLVQSLAEVLHVFCIERGIPGQQGSRQVGHLLVFFSQSLRPQVQVEVKRGLLSGSGGPRARRRARRVGDLHRPLCSQFVLVGVEAGKPTSGAKTDGGSVQRVHGVPPPSGHEETLPRLNDLLNHVRIFVEGELLVVRIVEVHLGIHFLPMVEVGAHLRWPQPPQLAAFDVGVEQGDGVVVQRCLSPARSKPEVRLRGVHAEEARVERLHIFEEVTHLRPMKQVVVGSQVDVVVSGIGHDVVNELAEFHIPPEEVLLRLKVLPLAATLLDIHRF
mmetsp:Transcript_17812/g.24645  ORF Transcript_17812/g.24645 Transcript_17812/m.24645 type:complete len:332 (-) Transcript_17812:890-1885(-)